MLFVYLTYIVKLEK
uniref:Uncharacterized protein n=1 Tax=Rhizophora mucronata TaxID=61149 RepID=A0A2P2Q3J2_RHIMU